VQLVGPKVGHLEAKGVRIEVRLETYSGARLEAKGVRTEVRLEAYSVVHSEEMVDRLVASVGRRGGR
jgi:hypothetical protein